jgi:hypothetical protein
MLAADAHLYVCMFFPNMSNRLIIQLKKFHGIFVSWSNKAWVYCSLSLSHVYADFNSHLFAAALERALVLLFLANASCWCSLLLHPNRVARDDGNTMYGGMFKLFLLFI